MSDSHTPVHNPVQGAGWMLSAGLAFAIVNSLAQFLSIKLHVSSTTFALIQYFVALVAMLPWLRTMGIRRSLKTEQFFQHCFRVFLAVIGIQLWLWALAYPVPIWQGIALLMTSPLFATIGSGVLLKEKVGAARWCATLAGFIGAMIILEPWSDSFSIATLLPVGAAVFWAGYSLMVKKQSTTESPTTVVMYLLILITPFNLLLALPDFTMPTGGTTWTLIIAAGLLTALAQWAIAKAYAVADASFVQPFDHAKLPLNVLGGWLVFGWVPPGRLWLGAAIIIASVAFITQWEKRK
ncbi:MULTISPECIES: DMT family transporter [unclassified Photobacterium]|uniref:DMT family transporter n=1 Tax=unclassified Photobacterium TaxID=2628852 RepID=UPI000D15702C|nr:MULTISPECIES: DMT family transporter [unclassified Photobacterium]PSV27544.1 EamA family transporter [Photobacterium sp. GB-56]PSV28563.1 EamA family transporter [Photobacterium sp. GB-72]PSV37217.1 EamA family transporter [Photobacterium sp. GB-27]PSV44588.1 EamA family transporter [Photobacterium sp. GB-36]PSV53538.1 EamA family transporter [Photobacterium sp. GB-3]